MHKNYLSSIAVFIFLWTSAYLFIPSGPVLAQSAKANDPEGEKAPSAIASPVFKLLWKYDSGG